MRYLVGIDVGGTFTDILVLDLTDKTTRTGKVLSTPQDQSVGFMAALRKLEVDLSEVTAIVHGTTVGTNAMLERKGSRTALVTTEGFRDVLELRNRSRPTVYGLTGHFEPLSPRECRFEVKERTSAEGSVLTDLDEDEMREALTRAEEAGCESLAIAFLHSYKNNANERRAKKLAEDHWHNRYITASSDLLEEIREFERTSTTVANAYVQPVLGRYVARLRERLSEAGFTGELLTVQSNGGLTDAEHVATTRAVTTILSGPAAGVSAAVRVAQDAGYGDVVTVDMGGTSLDLSVIDNGLPGISGQKEIEFGIPIRMPMVNIETVAIGGGSIARIDDNGILVIGPQSAGAVPGPAAYGRGGERPTITDANLILGRICGESGLAAEAGLRLNVALAETAINKYVGEPLGLDAQSAAQAIVDVTVNAIAGEIRKLTLEKGKDPRGYALLFFGGAGPLHAAEVMREVEAPAVLVPLIPGVLSAEGCAISDFRYDFVRTLHSSLDEIIPSELRSIYASHLTEGKKHLSRTRVADARIESIVEADLMFAGQSHPLRVSIPADDLHPQVLDSTFRGLYEKKYGRGLDLPVLLLNLRTTVIGRRNIARAEHASSGSNPSVVQRKVAFGGTEFTADVFQGSGFPSGDVVVGPAIFERSDCTIVVPPGVIAEVLPSGALGLKEAS